MSQGVLFGDPPQSTKLETRKKTDAFQAMQTSAIRRHYRNLIRARMRDLWWERYDRSGGFMNTVVTPDDARTYYDSLTPPKGLSRNFLAGVWEERHEGGKRVWKALDNTHRSTTHNSHGNKLNRYILVDRRRKS
jgi:hypothetical protein